MIDAVAKAVAPHSQCALLMFRDCDNFGDAAIWLGALDAFAELGVRVLYSQPLYRLRPNALRRAVGAGPVVVNGGGSFGNIYRKTQRFTHEVIAEFRDRPVVLLPQTVHFDGSELLDEAKRVIGSHRDLTLMCRDRVSFEFASTTFDCRVELVPDAAFALGPLAAARPPMQFALRLQRRDGESPSADRGAPAPPTVDWEDVFQLEPRLRTGLRVEELLYRSARRVGKVAPEIRPPGTTAIVSGRRLTTARLDAANRLLSRAECVVSDRLHAHLLAVLLGRFSIVKDNRFGKVRSFYNTWTSQMPTVAWADNDDDVADALARFEARSDGRDPRRSDHSSRPAATSTASGIGTRAM